MNLPTLAGIAPNVAIPALGPRSWHQVAMPLGVGLLLLAGIFSSEITAAVQTWIQSTAYNHCFLVIPIAVFLLWERRADIGEWTIRPTPSAAVLGVAVAAIWLVAERLGIMEGRQLAAIGFVQLLFLAVLGPRFWWALSGPLLYLFFLVPFGEFLTPILQDITASFIRYGLEILQIPAYIDGYIIEIPQATFLVAEACAGLRFLIASVAFGCLYALLMYRSPGRRGAFIVVSIAVPIIANGLRGLGIVYLGHLLNSGQAAAVDHLFYGWMFFSIVILLLIAVGLPFRQDNVASFQRPSETAVTPISVRWSSAAALALVMAAAVGPLLSSGLAAAVGAPVALPPTIDIGPDCTGLTVKPVDPRWKHVRAQRLTCDNVALEMTWEAFAPSITAAPLMLERHRLCQLVETQLLTESWFSDSDDRHRAWQIMRSGEPANVMAVSIWIDGSPVRPGLRMRLRMALSSLLGSAHAPMVMTVAPAVSSRIMTLATRQQAETSVVMFLRAHPELDIRVAAISALR